MELSVYDTEYNFVFPVLSMLRECLIVQALASFSKPRLVYARLAGAFLKDGQPDRAQRDIAQGKFGLYNIVQTRLHLVTHSCLL